MDTSSLVLLHRYERLYGTLEQSFHDIATNAATKMMLFAPNGS